MKKLFNYCAVLILFASCTRETTHKRPNILFCIADDASLEYMGAYQEHPWVKTPTFDQVAADGLLFMNAYTPNAKCSPSRACILTGRNPWQLEDAANHIPFFPSKFIGFFEVLKQYDYHTGYTGKGWAPGFALDTTGKARELTGKAYNQLTLIPKTSGISEIDYVANFKSFLKERRSDQPFCFWFGSLEPHRNYEYGSGINKGGKDIRTIEKVPPYWIDNDTVRTDMLDYAYELEAFDRQLKGMLDVLEEAGEMENTIIVVTSDNGMPFPRVKGFVYEQANHLPLAVMWKKGIKQPGRRVDDFVNFIDFAPTFLELAGVKEEETNMQKIQGVSLAPYFDNLTPQHIVDKGYVLLGRERTDVGRPNDEGYPVRGIVKDGFMYVVNYEPDRWPSGNPETGYMDTDGSPTKTVLLFANRQARYQHLWTLCFGKKQKEELYDIKNDPYCMNNLTVSTYYSALKEELKNLMEQELKKQGDPRMSGKGYIFDLYPYAHDDVKDAYNRMLKGEKLSTPWITDTDFEPK